MGTLAEVGAPHLLGLPVDAVTDSAGSIGDRDGQQALLLLGLRGGHSLLLWAL